MRIQQWLALGAMAGLVAVSGAARAESGEDDLAVVKKAVGKDTETARPAGAVVARVEARASAEASAPASAPRVRRGPAGSEPPWLRVRVVEKDGHKRNRVSVNLPLSLVRAIADDADGFPLDWKCRHGGRRCEIDLRSILRSLEAGQELVEVESDEATVKVWVE